MKWIKVSDQLPENPGSPVNWSEDVLILIAGKTMRVSNYYHPNSGNGHDKGFWKNLQQYVTHWMPLPTLPED